MIIPDAEREKGGNSHPITRNVGPNIVLNNTYTPNTNTNVSSWNGDYDYGSGTPRRNSSPAQSYYHRYSNSFANSDSVSDSISPLVGHMTNRQRSECFSLSFEATLTIEPVLTFCDDPVAILGRP